MKKNKVNPIKINTEFILLQGEQLTEYSLNYFYGKEVFFVDSSYFENRLYSYAQILGNYGALINKDISNSIDVFILPKKFIENKEYQLILDKTITKIEEIINKSRTDKLNKIIITETAFLRFVERYLSKIEDSPTSKLFQLLK